jgi:hypothetical protein
MSTAADNVPREQRERQLTRIISLPYWFSCALVIIWFGGVYAGVDLSNALVPFLAFLFYLQRQALFAVAARSR